MTEYERFGLVFTKNSGTGSLQVAGAFLLGLDTQIKIFGEAPPHSKAS
jgi:hypothetical protein